MIGFEDSAGWLSKLLNPGPAPFTPDFNQTFENPMVAPTQGVPYGMDSTPEAIAARAVQAGVAPPPLPAAPSLGASLEGSSVNKEKQGDPFPTPIGSPAEPGKAGGGNKFLDTLKGLKAPAQPTPMLPGQPSAQLPRQSPIQSGQLMQLIQMMQNQGGGQAPMSLKQRI